MNTELEQLEFFVSQQKEQAQQRLNTPLLMRQPEGMVSAFDIVLRKIKELKEGE